MVKDNDENWTHISNFANSISDHWTLSILLEGLNYKELIIDLEINNSLYLGNTYTDEIYNKTVKI